jgi:hypothetical protein
MRRDGHDPERSETPEGRLTKMKVQAHATNDGVLDPVPSFSWGTLGRASRETTEKGDKEMGTTATPSRATTIAFPPKYFVLAFAFTWFFWGLTVLGARRDLHASGLYDDRHLRPDGGRHRTHRAGSGRAGVRSLLGRVVRWGVSPVW